MIHALTGVDQEAGINDHPVHGLRGTHPWIPGATFRAVPGLAEWLALSVTEFFQDPEQHRIQVNCPYWLSQMGHPGRMGAHGVNTCSGGCHVEPVCMTG